MFKKVVTINSGNIQSVNQNNVSENSVSIVNDNHSNGSLPHNVNNRNILIPIRGSRNFVLSNQNNVRLPNQLSQMKTFQPVNLNFNNGQTAIQSIRTNNVQNITRIPISNIKNKVVSNYLSQENSTDIISSDSNKCHLYYQKHEREMFINIRNDPNIKVSMMQFKNDCSTDINFVDKVITVGNKRRNVVNKQLEEPKTGGGSKFKIERNYKHLEKTDLFFTVSNKDKNYYHQYKAVPSDITSYYMILTRKDNKTFEATPVDGWYKMNSHVEKDIEENIDLEKYKKAETKVISKYKKEEEIDEIKKADESDDEAKLKQLSQDRKRKNFVKKLRYGKDKKGGEESDHGEGEDIEIDYMSSDSSMDEDKLDEKEKELIYDISNVYEEEDVNKLIEEEIDESIKNVENNKTQESDDDDDDDSDSDSDDSDINTETIINNLKRKDVELDTNPDDLDSNEDNKTVVLRRNIREAFIDNERWHIVSLYKLMLTNHYLDNSIADKKLFYDVIDIMNLRTETINQEKYCYLK